MTLNREEKIITTAELAELGDGEVAYIRMMSSDEAHRLFPAVEGLPKGINIYALHAADGRPIALTDTMQAALGHALEDELQVASIH
ncbi:MAG: DUF1150 domain-containing protein [Hyphomicrobiaceae bacterium]|nr:DUF1150 domain-containing protein [Hyphomicrobiaceae bacterium]